MKHLGRQWAKSWAKGIAFFGLVPNRNVSNALQRRNQPQPQMITLSLKTF